jgi:hypothetical protein
MNSYTRLFAIFFLLFSAAHAETAAPAQGASAKPPKSVADSAPPASVPASSAGDPVEAVIAQALQLNLDTDPQWLNLLNYRRDFFFWKRGQADNPAFYIGDRWDPRAELIADLKAVFDPRFTRKSPGGDLDERFQCIFPGRFLYFTRKLKSDWPAVKCPRYENFRDILNAHSATYVFSSYFLNNPSSAFGHSFLRLNRADQAKGEKKYELIDFGVGYTAVPTTDNAALYAFMGIAGLFPGRFETHPYYYKVREYNDFESRDLWEYDLDFTQDEVNLLVAHAFELDAAGFNYIYFTENCAYRILAMMDSVRPSLHLIERSKIDQIPGESVAVVASTPGFVKEVHYRPSSRAIFMARLQTLNAQERDLLARFIENENLQDFLKDRGEEEKQKLLDAAMDYIDFKYADDVLHEKGKYFLKKKVLIARSEVALRSPELTVPVPRNEAPDRAHGSTRTHLGYMKSNGNNVMTLGQRYALHDLLDPVSGYPANSEIQMLGFDFTWDQEHTHRFQAEDINLVEIVSLSPLSEFNKAISWRLKFSLSRLYQDNCDNCLPVVLSGGVGYSKEWNHFLAGLWLRGSVAYSPDFHRDKEILGAGPALLVRYNYSDKFNFLGEAWYRYDYKALHADDRELSAGTQYNFTKDLGLRALSDSDRNYRLELEYYY